MKNTPFNLGSYIALAAMLVATVGCSSGSKGGAEGGSGEFVTLDGAGATFPAPIYEAWFKQYADAHDNVQIKYQGVGSGTGIANVTQGIVDFGASDAAMTEEEMAKVERGVQLLPMTAGAIVMVYNLDGVDDLKLSREAYSKIFLGEITKWNDPLIAATNEGVELPDQDIQVVVRTDSSGTTFNFTQHLSAISEDFKDKVGTEKQPNWPVGTKANKNDGIVADVKTKPGAIGYVEYTYAELAGLPTVLTENKAGKFIKPSIESAQKSLEGTELPESLIVFLPDPEGEDSYPIVTYTWIIAYKTYDNEAKVKTLKDLLKWCLTEGQKSSEELGYIPLPSKVTDKVIAALDNINYAATAK